MTSGSGLDIVRLVVQDDSSYVCDRSTLTENNELTCGQNADFNADLN